MLSYKQFLIEGPWKDAWKKAGKVPSVQKVGQEAKESGKFVAKQMVRGVAVGALTGSPGGWPAMKIMIPTISALAAVGATPHAIHGALKGTSYLARRVAHTVTNRARDKK